MTRRARHRRLLVTGCGRSGSKYIAFVCRRLGLDVRHEQLGRDGIASWTMAVPAERRPFGPPSATCSFDHVFHQVREPLAAIRSATTFGPESWEFIAAHLGSPPGEPVVLRAARYWLGWNERAEEIAEWRYRVEDIRAVLPEFCERIGATYDPTVPDRLPTDVNTRRSGRRLHIGEELFERLRLDMPERVRARLRSEPAVVTPAHLRYEDIDRLDPALGARIRATAARYGYAS